MSRSRSISGPWYVEWSQTLRFEQDLAQAVLGIVTITGVAGDFAVGGDNAFLGQVVACVDEFYRFAIGVGDLGQQFAVVAVGGDVAAGVASSGQFPRAIVALVGFCLVAHCVCPRSGRTITAESVELSVAWGAYIQLPGRVVNKATDAAVLPYALDFTTCSI